MPHVTGGGSNMGGSHGSGYSSHLTSHPKVSSVYLPYHRFKYIYFYKGKERCLYSETQIGKELPPISRFTILFNMVILAIYLTVLCVTIYITRDFDFVDRVYHMPRPIEIEHCQDIKRIQDDNGEIQNIVLWRDSNVIQDDAGVIQNPDAVYEVLQDFQNQTGIATYVVTVFHSEWEKGYSLQKYAYEKYEDTFFDEQHLLIMVSINDTPANERKQYSDKELAVLRQQVKNLGTSSKELDLISDWCFKIIQGNELDDILTEEKGKVLVEEMQKQMESSNGEVSKSIVNTFYNCTDTIMKPVFDGRVFAGVISVCLMQLLLIFVGIRPLLIRRRLNKVLKYAKEIAL